jgi:hypothetical protein
MIDGIYGNGCSFMYGYFLDNLDIAKHYDFVKNKSKQELIEFRKENNYLSLLGKHMNLPVINESDFGGSMRRVIRMTYDFIIKNYDTAKNYLYILEYPPDYRTEVWSSLQKKYIKFNYTTSMNDSDSYEPIEIKSLNAMSMYHMNPELDKIEEYKAFLGLVKFMESLDLKFHIIMMETNNSLFYNNLFKKYYIPFISNDTNIIAFCAKEECRFMEELGNTITTDNHPSYNGHKLIANQIYRYLLL